MQTRLRVILAALITCIACLSLFACGSSKDEPLQVLGAASTFDIVRALGEDFRSEHDQPVASSFAATSKLAKQIEDGRSADVFISANLAWMTQLADKDLLLGEPVVIARNSLVCIVSAQSTNQSTSARDFPKDIFSTIAIANKGVPAGDYARESLERIGLLAAITPKLVGQSDVRAVLNAVTSGNADAGIVYASDAKAAGEAVRVLFPFNMATHTPIEYIAAVIKDAKQPEAAREFIAFLQGEQGAKRLEEAGFQPAKNK